MLNQNRIMNDEYSTYAQALHESNQRLKKGQTNLVAEVLKGQGTFYEMEHYPKGDVFDPDTHAQYYYHAHRGIDREHGHFHTFIRSGAFLPGTRPASGYARPDPWPEGEEALMHLVGISVDDYGSPMTLFVTNRWVTGETWFDAETVIQHIRAFCVDHATPNWAVNVYLTALVQLYLPEIASLLRQRDQLIATRRKELGPEILEHRELEILAQTAIDPARKLKSLGVAD